MASTAWVITAQRTYEIKNPVEGVRYYKCSATQAGGPSVSGYLAIKPDATDNVLVHDDFDAAVKALGLPDGDRRVLCGTLVAACFALLAKETTPVDTKFLRLHNLLLLQVLYPNCAKCAYEGLKTLVFEGVPEEALIKWRELDPHFRAAKSLPHQAPSPIARFPGSVVGWEMAILFAQAKGRRLEPL